MPEVSRCVFPLPDETLSEVFKDQTKKSGRLWHVSIVFRSVRKSCCQKSRQVPPKHGREISEEYASVQWKMYARHVKRQTNNMSHLKILDTFMWHTEKERYEVCWKKDSEMAVQTLFTDFNRHRGDEEPEFSRALQGHCGSNLDVYPHIFSYKDRERVRSISVPFGDLDQRALDHSRRTCT